MGCQCDHGNVLIVLNLCLRSSTFGLLVTLSVGISGCTSESLVTGDGGGKKAAPPDGSVTGIDADPAACGCQVDGYYSTLTISWDCYCAQYDCTQRASTISCSGIGSQWNYGCGFQALSAETVGGFERWVYTDAGQLIGVQLATDDGVFTCPTDPGLHGYVLRAGVFPIETCEAQTACPCPDGVVSCPTAPSPDGGTLPPPPAGAAI